MASLHYDIAFKKSKCTLYFEMVTGSKLDGGLRGQAPPVKVLTPLSTLSYLACFFLTNDILLKMFTGKTLMTFMYWTLR